jgi:hypothetical protein
LASPNNNRDNSIALFHNDISINHNSGSKSIQLLQQSKVLGVSIKVGENPITWGNEQTIKITVFDPSSNQPIPNAIVTGAITFPSLGTGIGFRIATDSLGTTSYSWLIADNNAKAGVYNLAIRASAFGYNTTSTSTRFTVMPLYTNTTYTKPIIILTKLLPQYLLCIQVWPVSIASIEWSAELNTIHGILFGLESQHYMR